MSRKSKSTMNSNKRYVIISSAFNEEDVIDHTIDSITKQTILPLQWIIVDDGSTDQTYEKVVKRVAGFHWIKVLSKANSNCQFGEHVAINFNYGMSFLDVTEYDFIVKLDMDLAIDRDDYFEFQIVQMGKYPELGISSGITYFLNNGQKLMVMHPYWRTTGAIKFYRHKCFEDIGGIASIYGWDGLDDLKARYHGWQTRTFYELEVNHLKKHRDLSRKTRTQTHINNSKSYYNRGYSFFFISLKTIVLIKKSGFRNACAFFLEFLRCSFAKEPKWVSKDEQRFIRQFQLKRLFNKID